jgi:rod shape-determining protein MreC
VRRTVRPRFTLLLLLLTAATLIILNGRSDANGVIDRVKGYARDAFAPVQSASRSAFRPVGNVFGGVLHYGELKDENARLRNQVQELQADRLRTADATRERQALLDEMNLKFVGDIPTSAARVVSASSSNFELTVQIDHGSNDGIVKGMPVVAGGGLVGRITEVSRIRSTVQLITAPTSNVGIRLASSGDVGVAEGEGRGANLRVDLVENSTKVKTNEAVVTSGLQLSQFPPGIPIGRVKSASKATVNSLERDIRIKPSVDFRRLTFVQVLLWSPAAG